MKRLNILIMGLVASALLFGASPLRAQSPVFLSVIEDLPLMPGFVEDTDGALKFETEAGRIAEVTASGAGTTSAVVEFYSNALPQLGWQLETPMRYRREGEILVLEVLELEQNGAGVEVHYQVSPATEK